MEQGYRVKAGTGAVNNGAKTLTLFSCPTNGRLYVVGGNIQVTTASSGGAGLVQLVESATGTIIFSANAAALSAYQVYFGETGYPMTAGNDLVLKVTGGTTEATCNGAIVGYSTL